jgi:hypothetical protein
MNALDIPPLSSDTESMPPESDAESSPPESDKTYSVKFVMAPPVDANISLDNALWAVVVVLRGVDLAFMQQGLLWTTQNFLLLGGYLRSSKSVAMWKDPNWEWSEDMVRTWELREFPGRPVAESRWSGEIYLCAHSVQTLAGFRLGQLRRQLICGARVTDDAGNQVFQFIPEDPAANKNELFDSDQSDLWWLWPMESIIPEDEGESSSRPQAAGGEEKRAPGGRVTDGRISWPDVAALLCAAPAMSILVVAWGIFVLLTAASTVVLEFGRDKMKRESELHATDDGPSRKDLGVHCVTEFIQLFKGKEGPTWWDLVWGALFIVWGLGGFVLGAIAFVRNA